MIINPLVRPANFKDHQQLSNLIFFETRLHRHMDWRSPLELLGAPFYWALEEGGQVIAALACSPEAKGINWVRMFVYAGRWDVDHAWNMLWATTREEISRSGGATVAAIAMHPWFQQVIAASGFTNRQQIVMLEWRYQPWDGSETNGIRIRKMTEADLPEVEKTDAASFTPLWQNPLDTLRKAFSQTLFATVAEDEHGIVGYQLTTGGRTHAHLARLAVHPSAQGRGAGRSLLNELFARLTQMGVSRLTVNTQSDNDASLGLYQKMGFVRTGERYPVYTFEITPEED
ncbi:MAG: GNAT family N-acetyltransferase [Anaerolineae bacterium]|nr:GNAT family N-acetyltransferase [Anaerolineae bacterium]MCI0611172.1 GNAT family N-acetyltransferase [Anaerolineae bacterium]